MIESNQDRMSFLLAALLVVFLGASFAVAADAKKTSSAYLESQLEKDPAFEKNYLYETQIIEQLAKSGDLDGAISRLYSRVTIYREMSPWYEKNRKVANVLPAADSAFERTARQLIYQAQPQKSEKRAEKWERSKQASMRYLDYFAKSVHSAEVRQWLGNLLLSQKSYQLAADQYEAILGSEKSPAQYRKVLSQAILAIRAGLEEERAVQGLPELKSMKTVQVESEERTPYTELENRIMKLYGMYLKQFPTDSRVAEIMYDRAHLLYLHRNFEEAQPQLEKIVFSYPTFGKAERAAMQILEVHQLSDNLDAVIEFQKRLLKSGPPSASFRSKIAGQLRQAEMKRIARFEAQKAYEAAAVAYLAYCREYGPQDKVLYEKALYSAGRMFGFAEKVSRAADAQERFLSMFPKSARYEEVEYSLAQNYATLGSYGKASTLYLDFSRRAKADSKANSSLFLAGLYAWGSSDYSTAAKAFRQIHDLKGSKAAEAEYYLMDIYRAQNKLNKAIAFQKELRSRGEIPADEYVSRTLEIADLQFESRGSFPHKTVKEAIDYGSKSEKQLRQTKKGRRMLAKLMFIDMIGSDSQFYKKQLSLSDMVKKNAQTAITNRKKQLKELDSQYRKIIELGPNEWTVAALYKNAAAHRHVTIESQNAPAPKNLKGLALEFFQRGVKDALIDPSNSRALILANQCLDQARELNLFSSWTARCYGLASEIDPENYPVARTWYLPSAHIALITPDEKSHIALGDKSELDQTMFSSGIFGMASSKGVKGSRIERYLREQGLRDISVESSLTPMPIDYRLVASERKTQIGRELSSAEPSKGEIPTFSYLNLLRTSDPKVAIKLTREMIIRDPNNAALQNLLGLSLLEVGELSQAETVWKTLLLKGAKDAAIWNNLGVVYLLRGDEERGIKYFRESSERDGAVESLVNLGFLALKYRNGGSARVYFEQARSTGAKLASLEVGITVAQVQNRDLTSLREVMIEMSKKLKDDPYARISVGYYLMDVESENELAEQIISDYLQSKGYKEEGSAPFERALHDVKRSRGNVALGE